MSDPYLRLGRGYVNHRRPDPRIAEIIHAALGSARTVVNVGAGAGAYEPSDRHVLAVEPSAVMIEQRPPGAAAVIRATAEQLPIPDQAFDVGLAVLTVHHWQDPAAGLAELRRVSQRQVILTWDNRVTARHWLVEHYLPEIAEREARLATAAMLHDELERQGAQVTMTTIEVPADCTDGFLGAYWRRPASYLDPDVRAAISGIASLDQSRVRQAMKHLADDLSTGRWHQRHAHLLRMDGIDLGYRLITAK